MDRFNNEEDEYIIIVLVCFGVGFRMLPYSRYWNLLFVNWGIKLVLQVLYDWTKQYTRDKIEMHSLPKAQISWR